MDTKQRLRRSVRPAAIISIIAGAIRWVAGNMLGDYIVRSLSAYGISADAPIAWFLAWVFASPLNILVSTFIIVLIISLLIDNLNKKENEKIETQTAIHLEVDSHGKVAGRDIVETHHHYSEEKRQPVSDPNINIEISYFVLAETIAKHTDQ